MKEEREQRYIVLCVEVTMAVARCGHAEGFRVNDILALFTEGFVPETSMACRYDGYVI